LREKRRKRKKKKQLAKVKLRSIKSLLLPSKKTNMRK